MEKTQWKIVSWHSFGRAAEMQLKCPVQIGERRDLGMRDPCPQPRKPDTCGAVAHGILTDLHE